MAERVQPWAPHRDRVELMACGGAWDAIKVPRFIGRGGLERLGDETGAVIEDPYGHVVYWLVLPGTADTWDLYRVDRLGTASYLAVPPVERTEGPGVHWRVPLAPERYLTAPEALHAALVAEVNVWTGPRAVPPS